MITQDLHVHTSFCDGANTPEEMVQAAIQQGLTCLGFSAHSHTPFDESYCLSVEKAAAYRAETARLKEKYHGQIQILCGIEQDLYSDMPTDGYDYVIGSVHYLCPQGVYFSVDENPQQLRRAIGQFYGGDFYALAEDYFRTVAKVVSATGCDIIGHFDLISKFNRDGQFFDENHPRYVAAWSAALDALCPSDALFEVNTGAISRGYQNCPYPSLDMLPAIVQRGGRLILSSDSHRANTLCFGFQEWHDRICAMGLKDSIFSFPVKI